jgi:hypothetical protein
MSHFLGYMQHYWKSHQGPWDVEPGWGTQSEYFHRIIEPGDILWIVVTGGPNYPNEWRLLQRIEIVEKHYENGHAYPYQANGDPKKSRVFDPDLQLDFALLLKRLEFASGKKIYFSGRRIGLALQSIRRLTDKDGKLLEEYASW